MHLNVQEFVSKILNFCISFPKITMASVLPAIWWTWVFRLAQIFNVQCTTDSYLLI